VETKEIKRQKTAESKDKRRKTGEAKPRPSLREATSGSDEATPTGGQTIQAFRLRERLAKRSSPRAFANSQRPWAGSRRRSANRSTPREDGFWLRQNPSLKILPTPPFQLFIF